MGHPFFNAIKFPVHIPEAFTFLQLLTNTIPNTANIDLLYKRCAQNPPPLLLAQPPNLLWNEALNNLTVIGALNRLCDIIETEPGFNPQLKAIVRKIIEAKPAYEKTVYSDGVVVLDRTSLREQIEQLENESSLLKVLLVRGEPQSGKSHGQYIFERTAKDNGAKPVYVFDGFVVTVDELVTYLFTEVKADGEKEIPPRDTTPEAWYRMVCFKLAQLAAAAQQPLWIAADDLGNTPDGTPLLDPEIRKFFDQLALNMLNASFRKWFRLMLINYPDGPVPTKWRNDIWKEDTTKEADIQIDHITDFLRNWCVENSLNITDADLLTLALKVWDTGGNAAPSPYSRLKRINDALSDTLRELKTRTTL